MDNVRRLISKMKEAISDDDFKSAWRHSRKAQAALALLPQDSDKDYKAAEKLYAAWWKVQQELESAMPPSLSPGMPSGRGELVELASYRGYGIWGGQDDRGYWWAFLPGLEYEGYATDAPDKKWAVGKIKQLIDYRERTGKSARPKNPRAKRKKAKRNPDAKAILRRAMRGT